MNVAGNVKRYCETCLARKHSKKEIECSIENAIEGIGNKKCYQVILHLPGRKDEVVANCSCMDEASIYGDYLANALWVGIQHI